MPPFRDVFRRSAILLVALGPVAMGAQARDTWVVTPYAGVYLPSANLARFDGGGAHVKMRQENAAALGANLNYWFAERMSVEFGGLYTWSHAKGSANFFDQGESFAEAVNEHAYVMMGTAKLMFALLPPSGETQLRFGIGPAVIKRGGTAYKADPDGQFTGLTNFGGALSLCTRIPLGNRLAIRLRAEDYVYQARIKFRDPLDSQNNFSFDRELQNDFVISAGLHIGFSR